MRYLCLAALFTAACATVPPAPDRNAQTASEADVVGRPVLAPATPQAAPTPTTTDPPATPVRHSHCAPPSPPAVATELHDCRSGAAAVGITVRVYPVSAGRYEAVVGQDVRPVMHCREGDVEIVPPGERNRVARGYVDPACATGSTSQNPTVGFEGH